MWDLDRHRVDQRKIQGASGWLVNLSLAMRQQGSRRLDVGSQQGCGQFVVIVGALWYVGARVLDEPGSLLLKVIWDVAPLGVRGFDQLLQV